MMIVVLVVVAAAALAAYWFLVRHARHAAPEPRARSVARRFGGVEIMLRPGACDAARALEGQRFLANEAPTLPLRKCDAAQCTCAFTKLADRRTDDRRFEHGGLGASLYQEANRRAGSDRRNDEAPAKRR